MSGRGRLGNDLLLPTTEATRAHLEGFLVATEGEISLQERPGGQEVLVAKATATHAMFPPKVSDEPSPTALPGHLRLETDDRDWKAAYLDLALQVQSVKSARLMGVQEIANERRRALVEQLLSKRENPGTTKQQRLEAAKAVQEQPSTPSMNDWAEIEHRTAAAAGHFFNHQLRQLFRLMAVLDEKLKRS